MGKNTDGSIPWIDALKGIGILCVVVGHCTARLNDVIYMFHMPLFFFISGFLFRPAPAGKYALKKARHILLPYLFFSLLLAPLSVAFDFSDDIFTCLKDVILTGKQLGGPYVVFWFPVCLFITQIVFNLIVKLHKGALAVLMAVCLTMAYIGNYLYTGLYLPWSANAVLYALPIFYIGYIVRDHWLRIETFMDKYAPAAVSLAIGAIVAAWFVPLSVDMKSGNYGIPIISMLCGFATISGLIYACRSIISRMPFPVRRPLNLCGKASMTIMYLHVGINIALVGYGVDQAVSMVLAVLLPIAFYFICERFAVTRKVVLGMS